MGVIDQARLQCTMEQHTEHVSFCTPTMAGVLLANTLSKCADVWLVGQQLAACCRT
jgi:hypothetical protein